MLVKSPAASGQDAARRIVAERLEPLEGLGETRPLVGLAAICAVICPDVAISVYRWVPAAKEAEAVRASA